ncbi:MAG TPA: SIMPL domain-containing protein [Acetobacteraceae bacterium]|nr:SIMPL domain-containing protein [Acetobacteraceae bacterium]
MRFFVPALLAGALFAMAGPAGAATTILHVSATASVKAMPDELDAELAAEAGAHGPAAAQNAVNAMIGKGLATTRAVSAVTTSTGTYSVWYVTDPHPEWRAQQSLVLSARDGPALLSLIGQLQAQGLAVTSLGWRLADETLKAASDRAQAIALAMLKGRAEAAAKVLGLHFTGFREVWLTPRVPPLPIQPMALMAGRVSAPNAVPAETMVTATVEADVTLEAAP